MKQQRVLKSLAILFCLTVFGVMVAFAHNAPATVDMAAMISPTNDSTLTGSSQTFTWNSVGGDRYAIWIGTTEGAYDINAQATAETSITVNSIPVDGRKLYVRLWTRLNGKWGTTTDYTGACDGTTRYCKEYTYTATGSAQALAELINPANGSTLTSGSQTFTWNSTNADKYSLWIGSSAGAYDLFVQATTGTSITATGLPTDGRTVYVRLWTRVQGKWGANYKDYTVTAFTSVKYALIFNGITTCSGCPEAVATMVGKVGLKTRYVTKVEDIPALLGDAALFAIGGTEDNIEPLRMAFTQTITDSLNQYLQNGGRYLGICGGAFMASRSYVNENGALVTPLNIIPADTDNYTSNSDPQLVNVIWRGATVSMYLQGGPKFVTYSGGDSFEVVATYSTDGSVAAMISARGKGKVLVFGPHPEADRSWLTEGNINNPNWQPNDEMAIATLNDLLSSRVINP